MSMLPPSAFTGLALIFERMNEFVPQDEPECPSVASECSDSAYIARARNNTIPEAEESSEDYMTPCMSPPGKELNRLETTSDI